MAKTKKKKTFFREATKAQVKKKELVQIESVVDIAELGPDLYAIINPLVPRGFESARKFMKHGREVKLQRACTLADAVRMAKTPIQLREQAFNDISRADYCGYSFMPIGKDRRKRKVALIECLEGARLFAYAHQVPQTRIDLKAYADSARVRRDGAEVVGSVPSRRQGERRIPLKLISVPMVDSGEKYGIALGIHSDHSCPSKRFNIRFTYSDDKESSEVVNVCAHEIALYFELIQREWEENKNMVPLQMCQYAIPSQETVDYYLKWENNLLVRDEELSSKDKLRKPNRAEKEIGLWAWVDRHGHDETFYSKGSRDGDVREYRWR